VMQINAQMQGFSISWTYDYVFHRFGATTEELRMDAESLCSWIRMRREDLGLPGDWRAIDGRFKGCWFVLDGAREAFAAMGDKITLFMDSTHNKNRFGMRLFMVSCVGWSGNTEVCVMCRLADVSIFACENADHDA